MVINTINEEMSFCDYYSQWVDVYKEGAIREVTMKKYKLTQACRQYFAVPGMQNECLRFCREESAVL